MILEKQLHCRIKTYLLLVIVHCLKFLLYCISGCTHSTIKI